VAGGATGDSSTASVGITTTGANDLIIAITAADSGDPVALGTGYVTITMGNPFNFANGEYNLDVGAAGSKTVQMDCTTASIWGIYAEALNPCCWCS
jgi:hypothetical protein